MKKLFLLFAFAPFCLIAQNKIDYNVYYDGNLEKNGLKVQAVYHNDTDADSTVFYYNNSHWGEENLFNCITILKKDNPGISFVTSPQHNRITVYHPKTKKATLTYRIKQDYKDPEYHVFDRPVVKNNYFHILGTGLFAVPDHFTKSPFDKQLEIGINWVGFPENFKIHNTFESQKTEQKIKTVLWDGFYKSVFVGGDYRIHEFKFHDKPVYFAVRGNWYNGFSDEFLFSNMEKAIRSQRDFWRDYSQEYFTMIMTPTVSQNDSLFKGSSNNGTAVKNGFVIKATNNPFNNKELYMYLLHHELMHEWIGGKIKNKHNELNYWFSEGFTEYYTYKNRLRINDVTFAQWLDLFNKEIVAKHWQNTHKNTPNYKIKDDYWKDADIEKVPYRRGAIFAFWLDNQILLKSNYTQSLDDLMRDLLEHCTANNTKFTDELLVGFAQKYLNKDISYFLQKHIIIGEDINLAGEKWVDGLEFVLTGDNIPQLVSTKNNREKYILK